MALGGVVHTQSANLGLSISFDKPAYFPGEPVVAHVLVANPTAAAIAIPEQLDPEYMRIVFMVKRNDEPEVEFRPWALMENQRMTSLAPGASIDVHARIYFGAEGWTFARPATYRVRAVLGRASSNTASLTVQTPTSEPERTQSARLSDNREAGFFLLFDGGDHLTNGKALLQDIASTATRFAGFATYALGASLSKRFADAQTGQVRAPDMSQAAALLERSNTLLPADSVYFKLLSRQRLIDVNRLQGRQPQANQLQLDLNRFVQQDLAALPLSPALRTFAEKAIR